MLMAYKKRRTAAQIRATKKLVALNKKRARKNSAGPRKTPLQRLKARRQLKRGHKATARWVRAGMPSQRNKSRKRCATVHNPKRGAPKGWVKAKYVRVVRGPRGSRILEVKR